MRGTAVIVELDAAHASKLDWIAKILAETKLNPSERAHFYAERRILLIFRQLALWEFVYQSESPMNTIDMMIYVLNS